VQVVIAAEPGGALGGMVRQLSIDQFENEGRRVIYGTPDSTSAARKLLDRQMSINSVPNKVTCSIRTASFSIIKFVALLWRGESRDLVIYIDLTLKKYNAWN
jgi:hypothetical protein